MRSLVIKKLCIYVFLFNIFIINVFAQVPQAINFQAIARDNSGNPLIDSDIQLRLSVLDSNQNGKIIYQEIRSLKTNTFGSFAFQIGINPKYISYGDFQNINWQTGNKHLKIDYDPTNTYSFTLSLGVIKFVTVPFSFVSEQVVFIDIKGAQDGDVLIYNSLTEKFESKTPVSKNIEWNTIQNTPTTLNGYGIIDAQKIITEWTDEFNASENQTVFTLTQIPSPKSKVKMYINGVRISNTAYSINSTNMIYNPINNGNYSIEANDRIQFDYFY